MAYLRRKRHSLPPGPPQLPILGNYFAFSKDSRLFTVFAEMEKKYGDIFTVNFGFGHNSIVVSSVDLVNELLVEKSEEFAGRDTSLWSLYLMSGGYKDVAFADYGPVWTVQKKMAVKVLRSYVFSGKLDCLAKSAFEEVAPLLAKQSEPVDVDFYISLLIYNIICRFAFGKSYEIDDPEFVWLRKSSQKI
ncbi:steroid 17-alpha-hydroxylase/17,20 lyase-like [Lingula anatina]|uniref:Steroid 17-alpha-hydroxylase/17,20 lyase-like n=1 Tax=Lingula anatina TaxID=7574 RepID=A0A1S3HPN7_LINAN|nr:steroid 17-alpha-hydroxylase/17,20 lyase-like [Lingula anatina]|eukprot:XP_013388002.1 steroid 17-alpha-hydroxylase/17,20 lyase-like [Lingula anatina]